MANFVEGHRCKVNRAVGGIALPKVPVVTLTIGPDDDVHLLRPSRVFPEDGTREGVPDDGVGLVVARSIYSVKIIRTGCREDSRPQ
ncbi:MAG: hypothetical protein BRD27_06625 [Bacteroidetes bacterium QH_10_64_19]|nr:MAG: hypothetical protein BRD27_06625 [Bacteroidetes bacterium QH_10_64_19]